MSKAAAGRAWGRRNQGTDAIAKGSHPDFVPFRDALGILPKTVLGALNCVPIPIPLPKSRNLAGAASFGTGHRPRCGRRNLGRIARFRDRASRPGREWQPCVWSPSKGPVPGQLSTPIPGSMATPQGGRHAPKDWGPESRRRVTSGPTPARNSLHQEVTLSRMRRLIFWSHR